MTCIFHHWEGCNPPHDGECIEPSVIEDNKIEYGISPIVKEREWCVSAIGSKEFCDKVSEYIKQLRESGEFS